MTTSSQTDEVHTTSSYGIAQQTGFNSAVDTVPPLSPLVVRDPGGARRALDERIRLALLAQQQVEARIYNLERALLQPSPRWASYASPGVDYTSFVKFRHRDKANISLILSFVPFRERGAAMVGMATASTVDEIRDQFIASWLLGGYKQLDARLRREPDDAEKIMPRKLRDTVGVTDPIRGEDDTWLVNDKYYIGASTILLRSPATIFVPAAPRDDKPAPKSRNCPSHLVVEDVAGCRREGVRVRCRDDRATVLKAVERDWLCLAYTQPELCNRLRKDKEVVLLAVVQDPEALSLVGEKLRKDREVVLAAVSHHGGALRWAPKELKADRELVLAAVRNSFTALQHADAALRSDLEIYAIAKAGALEAAKVDGRVLHKHTGKDLAGDVDVVMAAVKQNWRALSYVGPEMTKVRAIMEEAVRQDWKAMQYNSVELTGETDELYKMAKGPALRDIRKKWSLVSYVGSDLKKDREIILTCVKQDGMALNCAAPEMKKDREVVLAAYLQCKVALHHADPELKKDKEFKKIRKEALAARKREQQKQKETEQQQQQQQQQQEEQRETEKENVNGQQGPSGNGGPLCEGVEESKAT